MKTLRIEKGTSDKRKLKLAENEQTGFPSPANDHLEHSLSLDELIIKRPASTFFVRAEGGAMLSAGVRDGDLLAIDRSVNPTNGDIVVAAVDDETIIRKLICQNGNRYLVSGDNSLVPIRITPDMNWMIWGTVTYVIHHTRGK